MNLELIILEDISNITTPIPVITTIDNSIIKDIDGNEYTTIVVRNQEWTVENLKTTKYAVVH